MQKIAIITYHRSYNYGAALQSYATVRFLEDLGYEAKIIDYYPKNLRGFGTYKNSFFDVSNASRPFVVRCILTLLKTPGYKKLKKAFDLFIDRELPLTDAYYSNEEIKQNLPEADIYCTGSDQVWNNYYTQVFDGTYFLDFVPENKPKISFAASFGKSEFNNNENIYLREKLECYDYLSVRETTGQEIAKNIGFFDCDLMLDPTLMVSPVVWSEFAAKSLYDFEYILVYQLHGDSDTYAQSLKVSCRHNNMKIIRIITMPHQKVKGCINVVTPDIRQFISLFVNAEFVLTDSFHGTIYSILNNRKVGITMPVRFGNRITTLTSAIGAGKFIINDLEEWDNLDFPLIYANINEKLKDLRESKNKLFVKRMKKFE